MNKNERRKKKSPVLDPDPLEREWQWNCKLQNTVERSDLFLGTQFFFKNIVTCKTFTCELTKPEWGKKTFTCELNARVRQDMRWSSPSAWDKLHAWSMWDKLHAWSAWDKLHALSAWDNLPTYRGVTHSKEEEGERCSVRLSPYRHSLAWQTTEEEERETFHLT